MPPLPPRRGREEHRKIPMSLAFSGMSFRGVLRALLLFLGGLTASWVQGFRDLGLQAPSSSLRGRVP